MNNLSKGEVPILALKQTPRRERLLVWAKWTICHANYSILLILTVGSEFFCGVVGWTMNREP